MPSTELGLLNCGFFSVLSFVEMPKSVSFTCFVCELIRVLLGLMSLWIMY